MESGSGQPLDRSDTPRSSADETYAGPDDSRAGRWEEPTPESIGTWRVVGEIGRGGFGVVYRVQRERAAQSAALKLIKPGMDTRQVLARFESERQAMAMLSHPNIARFYESGIHASRPYFAMEYVAGFPITQYCDRNRLTIEDRLQLFMQVCAAIQHAHLKAIIHRDISARNVLVTEVDGKPFAKVIDFGIAKALGGKLADITLMSTPGVIIGNYAYMSPEQADALDDVDTRTDVYSLGVLLYELLTGERPLDNDTLRKTGEEGLKRLLRDHDTPRPGTKLAAMANRDEIAAARQTTSAALINRLKRELEWIPMMALRKERSRRYQTPAELSEDIARYLKGEALRAGPESRTYVAGKWVRRHRTALTTGTALLVTVLIVAGLSLALYLKAIGAEQARTNEALREAQGQRTEAERQRAEAIRQRGVAEQARREADASRADAEQREARAEAVVKFMTEDLLGRFGDNALTDKAVREEVIEQAVKPAADAVGFRFGKDPALEARMRRALADAFESMSDYANARTQSAAAADLYAKVRGPDHPETLQMQANAARIAALSTNDPGETMRHVAEVKTLLDRCRALYGDHATATAYLKWTYGGCLFDAGQWRAALPIVTEVSDWMKANKGVGSEESIRATRLLAHVLSKVGSASASVEQYQSALALSRAMYGNDDYRTITAMSACATAMRHLDDFEGAEKLLKEAVGNAHRSLGEKNGLSIWLMINYGHLLQDDKRYEEGERILTEALTAVERHYGPDKQESIWCRELLARCIRGQNRPAEAEPIFRLALARMQQIFPSGHPYISRATNDLAKCLLAEGKLQEAETTARDAAESALSSNGLGPGHPHTRKYAETWIKVLKAKKKTDEVDAIRKRFQLDEPATRKSDDD
jgi:serine/threonine protein kinase